jgi:hypothetical protein
VLSPERGAGSVDLPSIIFDGRVHGRAALSIPSAKMEADKAAHATANESTEGPEE